jgi:hypothetical protein
LDGINSVAIWDQPMNFQPIPNKVLGWDKFGCYLGSANEFSAYPKLGAWMG